MWWWSGKGCFLPKIWNCTSCPRKCSTKNITCVEDSNCVGGCVCLPPFYETNRGYCVLAFTEVCQAEAALGSVLNATSTANNTISGA